MLTCTTKTEVFVTSEFVALHRWPDAADPVEFLKHPHRHLFKVRLVVEVTHDNRDVEFLTLKDELINFTYPGRFPIEASCETMAKTILVVFTEHGYSVKSCEVSEDGENGAIVTVTEQ
jgi:hypothetical protein